jgi:hypothetical protein
MSELFARNIKYMGEAYGLVYARMAEAISTNHQSFSRYLNGTKGARKTLDAEQYRDAARYVLTTVCKEEAHGRQLCHIAKLTIPDFRELSHNEALVNEQAAALEYAMRNYDFAQAARNEDSSQTAAPSPKRRSVRNRLRAILAICAVFVAVAAAAVFLWWVLHPAETDILLEITGASPVGEPNSHVAGRIAIQGSGRIEDYRVTAVVVSPKDGRRYAPKPSKETPSVPLEPTERNLEGSFVCAFANGYADADVLELYVYVVPKDFIPSEDYEATQRAALAAVRYLRA